MNSEPARKQPYRGSIFTISATSSTKSERPSSRSGLTPHNRKSSPNHLASQPKSRSDLTASWSTHIAWPHFVYHPEPAPERTPALR